LLLWHSLDAFPGDSLCYPYQRVHSRNMSS
jgi:hypothetical protein